MAESFRELVTADLAALGTGSKLPVFYFAAADAVISGSPRRRTAPPFVGSPLSGWLVLTACVLIANAIAYSYFVAAPKSAQATAVLQVQPEPLPLDGKEPRQPTAELVRSHALGMTSEPVLTAVVRELKLERDPGFVPSPSRLAAPSRLATARDALARRLEVVTEGGSPIIRIKATDDRGPVAARVANSVAANYIRIEKSRTASSKRAQSVRLQRQVDDLGQETVLAENAAEDFRRRSGLVAVSEYDRKRGQYAISTPDMQELIETSREQATMDSRRIQGDVRYWSQQAAIARGQGDSTREVLESPLVARLREREDALVDERAGLRARHGPDHPLVIRADAKLGEIRRKISAEIARIHTSVAVDAEAGGRASQELRRDIRTITASRTRDVGISTKLMALRRDARLKRAAYERVAAASAQASLDAEMQLPDLQMISPAVPTIARKPLSLAVLLAIATLVGAAAGLAMVGLGLARRKRLQLRREG